MIEHLIRHWKETIMNGAYGIQTRGDPPLRIGARDDPRVVNITRDDSFKCELISSGITGRNDLYGRGMSELEMVRWGDEARGRRVKGEDEKHEGMKELRNDC